MIIKQRSLLVIFWLTLMCVVCASAWSETIRLKNGRIFEGEIAEEGNDEVKIILKSGLVIFSRDEIASIGDRQISENDIKEAVESLSTPAPVKKPVAKKAVKTTAVAPHQAVKKASKAITKVKKDTINKAVKPGDLPVVAADTVTVNSGIAADTVTLSSVVAVDTVTVITPSTSTETVPLVSSAPASSPPALPARPINGLTPSAKAAIVTIALAIIALIILMIKRISKQPKDKSS